MPEALVSYWSAWNEKDPAKVPSLLARAVTDDVEWNDPRDTLVGIGELEAAIRRLRTTKPDYRFVIASEMDSHHSRIRYRWDMRRGARTLMEGLDVVTLAPSGLISRVDGFFGPPTPIHPINSGVPYTLRQSTAAKPG
jgi:nuclear transport factor 2 (NTF2) superfamily protein